MTITSLVLGEYCSCRTGLGFLDPPLRHNCESLLGLTPVLPLAQHFGRSAVRFYLGARDIDKNLKTQVYRTQIPMRRSTSISLEFTSNGH